MHIHQILVRPHEHTVIILYEDVVGRRNSLVYDSAGNAAVEALIADAQQHLPPSSERPDKSKIEQEISELEYRLDLLKQSIGAA